MFIICKRIFDFISSLILFLFILPGFCVLAIMVRVKLGSPIFFYQARCTKNKKVFYIKKFRSMTDERNADGELLPDEERITRFGKFLRSSSLDEIPQLINIINGDMSVIGPRPLPPEYNDYYSKYEENRFLVKGGLIQPEVLHNKILPSWDEQLKWEADYALNLNVKTDIRIILAVFNTLINRNKENYGEIFRDSLINERKGK